MVPANRRWLAFSIARGTFTFFFLFTSLLALLAFIPFTYQQIHKGQLIPALNQFMRVHGWVHLAVAAIGIFALAVDRPKGEKVGRASKLLRWVWMLILVAQSIFLLIVPVMGRIQNNLSSYVISLIALIPVVLLVSIDWFDLARRVEWDQQSCAEDAAVFRAAWSSALFLAFLSTAWVYMRGNGRLWNLGAGLFAAGWDLASHLVALMLFFVVLNLVMVVSSWFPKPPRTAFLLFHLMGAGLTWLVLQMIVFPAVSFVGWQANLYSAVFALVTAACLSGLCLRLYAREGGVVQSGLALAFWIRNQRAGLSVTRLLAGLTAVGLVAMLLLAQTSKMDWNYLMQKLVVLLVWTLVFRICYQFAFLRPALRRHSMLALLTALLLVAGYRTLQASEHSLWKRTSNKVSSTAFLDQYSGYDVDLKLIRDVAVPRQTVDPGFYRFLSKHTNIPRSIQVNPVDIHMVQNLEANTLPKPNIFVLVVDSLRRDYLQPYNSSVKFTPSVEAFARESTVFENAFTHYGGTGLSEPSIWVGGMLLHQQYVTPFAPMNTLQKLLERDEYKSFISRDAILETVVTPWKGYVPLDENRSTMDYDACSSLEEIETKVGGEASAAGGLFSYTQPQNIHISRINREGAKPLDDGNYGSFYAPYASRLRRVDTCFGKFIQFLKDKNIYENSIVILTADHGDSLGEEGRWGHAYTIYPEIVQIPLLIHLPASLRGLQSTPKAVAFSTDITPTLYYLLGHRPIVHHEFLGHPLFTEQPEEQGSYRQDHYLVASSYAAVYGILKGDGSQLFVADGVNLKDYIFQLGRFGSSGEAPSTSLRSQQEARIREGVQAIGKWYGLEDH